MPKSDARLAQQTHQLKTHLSYWTFDTKKKEYQKLFPRAAAAVASAALLVRSEKKPIGKHADVVPIKLQDLV